MLLKASHEAHPVILRHGRTFLRSIYRRRCHLHRSRSLQGVQELRFVQTLQERGRDVWRMRVEEAKAVQISRNQMYANVGVVFQGSIIRVRPRKTPTFA